MHAWIWVVVVLVVLALLFAGVVLVQSRRRRGGVIVDPGGPAGPGDGSPRAPGPEARP
jgi:hypothetical protein